MQKLYRKWRKNLYKPHKFPAPLLQRLKQENSTMLDFACPHCPNSLWYQKELSQQILRNIEEKLDNVYARSHVKYITVKRRLKIVAVVFFILTIYQNRLKTTRKKFFKKVDKYEGVGNRRYMEFEFALPNELKTVEVLRSKVSSKLAHRSVAYLISKLLGLWQRKIYAPQ